MIRYPGEYRCYVMTAPPGFVKVAHVVPDEAADEVIRSAKELDPSVELLTGPDADAALNDAVDAAMRDARDRGEDPQAAAVRVTQAWRRPEGFGT